MRLQCLDLLRYGHFTDRQLEFGTGAPDLHIVFGPNEAGKSTALSAIEDMLFGIPVRSPLDFLHDYRDMRIGAVLEHDGQNLAAVRRKGARDTLLGTDGLPMAGGMRALDPFLANADRSFFARMFSLDPVRLRQGGQEILDPGNDIGQILFSAGAGISGLPAMKTRLSEEARSLWTRRRGATPAYHQADSNRVAAEEALRSSIVTASKWQELKRTCEGADARCNEITEALRVKSAASSRLGRIRRVYRHVLRTRQLEENIADLGPVIELPEDAAGRLDKAQREASDATARIETASAQLEQARIEIEGLTVDGNLLQRASETGALNEQRIEIRRERDDLPKRIAELRALEDEMRILAAEIGWTESAPIAIEAGIPKRDRLSVVRGLLTRHAALASDVANRKRECEDAEKERERLERQVRAFETPADSSTLAIAIRTVRGQGDVSGRLRAATDEAQNAARHVARILATLNPAVSEAELALAIRAPAAANIRQHAEALAGIRQRSREIRQQIADREAGLEQARQDRDRIVRDEQAITLEELRNSRENRDALWNLIKVRHFGVEPLDGIALDAEATEPTDLAAAFEPALRQADLLADRRFDKVEAVARLTELSRQIEDSEKALERHRGQQKQCDCERDGLHRHWAAMWPDAPFESLDPETMLAWLEARERLRAAVDACDAAARTAATCGEIETAARGQLLAACGAVGLKHDACDEAALPLLLERANDAQRELETQAEAKTRLEKDLEQAVADAERRRTELHRVQQVNADWNIEWSANLAALALAPDTTPDAVDGLLDIFEQMRERATQMRALRQDRIEKIRRDIRDFEGAVALFVRQVAPDLAGQPADEAVLEIVARLARAQRDHDQIQSRRKTVSSLEEQLAEQDRKRTDAVRSLSYLREAAGSESDDELGDAIRRSDTLRQYREEMSTLLATLVKDGDGRTLNALTEECASVDFDQVAAQETTLETERKDLTEQLEIAVADRSTAQRAFDVVDGNDSAARAAAQREEALTRMRVAAERYVRVQTSADLLQWAIDRYRQEKQAPLLTRAGELFAVLTTNSFTALQIAYDTNDKPELKGVRPDGQEVTVSGMSTGTADQLYLALRIASVEDYVTPQAAAGETFRAVGRPLPFIADDLFINFDDDRAAAGFRVLGEFAKKVQVLFFTHHQHLADIAETTLGGDARTLSL